MTKLFRKKNKKGFTLIELIVVIAILAILAAIAIPSFIGITAEADAKVELANAKNISTVFNAYQALNPDSQLADDVTMAAAKTAIGSMWPVGLDATTEAAAWAMVTITSGVATAAEPAA